MKLPSVRSASLPIGAGPRKRVFFFPLIALLFPWFDAALLAEDARKTPRTPAGGLLYFVNTTSDTVVANACANGLANCSLRGAITASNSHGGTDGIDISLPPGSVINLNSALPTVTDSVEIFGPGASNLTVRRASGTFRVLSVGAGTTVNISGLTLSNGNGSLGGAILNEGTTNLTNCALTGNIVTSAGGGIYNNLGIVTVTNCSITSNAAPSGGAGIYNASGTVTVTSSEVRNNLGGGILNVRASSPAILHLIKSNVSENNSGSGITAGTQGAVNATNSTISFNSASTGGGLITSGASLNLTNCTIVGNNATVGGGGGIRVANGNAQLKSCLVAQNSAADMTPDVSGDFGSAFTSAGFNLIGKKDGSTAFVQVTDQTGTIAAPLDPKIDPSGLQNNGGPTQTIALLATSPAIDKGTSNGLTGNLTTDQRGTGFSRTFDYPTIANAAGGDGTDIGAFELLTPYSVSRKIHGGTFPFDIQLPSSGAAGIECRSSTPADSHQIITTFASPVSVNSASVTSGTGTVGTVMANGAQIVTNLTGVGNAQTIVVTLVGVNDGTMTGNVAVPMALLLGDTSGNGSVNATDIGQTKAQSGQPLSAANFRMDANTNGLINASDIGLVKSRSGQSLP